MIGFKLKKQNEDNAFFSSSLKVKSRKEIPFKRASCSLFINASSSLAPSSLACAFLAILSIIIRFA